MGSWSGAVSTTFPDRERNSALRVRRSGLADRIGGPPDLVGTRGLGETVQTEDASGHLPLYVEGEALVAFEIPLVAGRVLRDPGKAFLT
jgi:hypothetical protein